ncbi:MAG: hypothetical protein K8I30_13405 [Anaerolineae bacterium]|nr:hypothetical protein [Anaerolineae bacterium]
MDAVMPEKAYIGLNDDDCWTLYYGDGSEDEKIVLAVGQPFEYGKAIRVVLDEMLAWAEANGYVLDAPLYSKTDITLEDLIDSSEWDEDAHV